MIVDDMLGSIVLTLRVASPSIRELINNEMSRFAAKTSINTLLPAPPRHTGLSVGECLSLER